MLYSEMLKTLLNKEVISMSVKEKYCDALDNALENGLADSEREALMGELTEEEIAMEAKAGDEWKVDLKIRADEADELAYAKKTFFDGWGDDLDYEKKCEMFASGELDAYEDEEDEY